MKKYRILSFGLAAAIVISTLPVLQVSASPDTYAKDENAASENNETPDAVETENIYINTPEEFLEFADKCHLDSWSVNKIVYLQQDIDLSGTYFKTVPVFAGVFDGGGHTISGFCPTDQGYIVGLFRYIKDGGIVRNLKVKGRIDAVNEKECIGSICGINYGTIRNCSFQGTVDGQNTVGGIAGINEASGNITNCISNGRITGYYSTGGIVGSNHGVITFCNNHSGINDNSAWVEEDDEMGTGLFFSFQASDDEVALYSGVDTGGIAGYSDGLIERCNNYATVGYEHTGYNIGGIVGRQTGIVLLCTNDGDVYGRKDVGGIVGQMEPDIEVDEAQSLRNAVNKLHDLIDKTLNDMQDGKNSIKSDLDALNSYGDGALTSGDTLAGQLADFVDDNMEQAQSITDRIDYIMDLLPEIMDNIDDAGDAFTRMTGVTDQLIEDLNFMDSLDDSAYNETDYSRIALLSTVGGRLFTNQINPAAGETVTVTAIPDTDYVLIGTISVVDADGTIIACSNGNTNDNGNIKYTFTMPSANVKVSAYFQHKDADSTFHVYVENEDVSSIVTSTSLPENGLEDEPDISPEEESDPSPEEALDPSFEEASDPSFEEASDPSPEEAPDPSPEETPDPSPEETPDPSPEEAPDPSPEETPDPSPGEDVQQDMKIMLHSNLSGDASYHIKDEVVTLTVWPDSGYTLNGTPTVTAGDMNALHIERTQSGSYQYEFKIDSAVSPIRVEITFVKLNKNSAVDTSSSNIQASIRDLQESSEYVNGCLQNINSIMAGKTWDEIKDNEEDKEKIIEEVVNMSGYLGQMSSSAASVLSNLSTLYNILSPYIQDALEAAARDIDTATNEIQSMIDSIREASRNVRGIVNYINAQPDIQFSTLGSEFDTNKEELHTQLMGISDSLKSLSNNASDYSDIVNEDLKAVNDQLNVVFNLLADHLTDASDLSVEELYEEVEAEDIDSIITGRTDSCMNNGIVKGDINIGGIAGAMSIDEEDPEDNAAGSIDYQIGRRFITKCIITESTNKGYVTAKKDGAGGIVGYVKHGIVSNCEGYGGIESTEGDYVGGIAGQSLTVINNCYALCSVAGGKNIGGIAGYANAVHECYAIVSVDASIGQKGAIAGQITSDSTEDIIGNYYVGDDLFGIDNISYAGIAEPISYNELLTIEHMPTAFWHLKVTYRIEDTYLGTQEVKFGESLANLDYPNIPAKEGYYGVWPDYSDRVMTCNLLIEGTYMDTVTVVESSEKTDSESAGWQKPYALVEQTFTEDTVLNVTLGNQTPPEEAIDRDYVIYDISLENADIGANESFAIRLLNPYSENVQVWGYLNGDWMKLDSKARGQYLQVAMTGSKEAFCIVAEQTKTLLIIVVIAAGAAILLLIAYSLKRVKYKLASRQKKN